MRRNRILACCFAILSAFFFLRAGAGLIDLYVNNAVTYNAWSDSSDSKWETDLISVFPGKQLFLNGNALMRNLFGQREMNKVIKLNNGYLATTFEDLDDFVLEEEADRISYVSATLSGMGVPFLYVATPETIAKYDDQLPAGIEDYGNINIDVMTWRLASNGVPVIDLREELYQDGIDPYSLMYRTDHHWTMEGGFYAFNKINDWICSQTGESASEELLHLDNYDSRTWKQWHLGSRGQRVGRLYAGADDFTLYYPKREMSLTRTEAGEKQAGSFDELVYNEKILESRDLSSMYTYDRVLEPSLGVFSNESAENDLRIMILCDSMGKAVCPFMIAAYHDVYYLDNYYPGGLTASLVEEWQPDVVILMQYPGLLGDNDAYEFSF